MRLAQDHLGDATLAEHGPASIWPDMGGVTSDMHHADARCTPSWGSHPVQCHCHCTCHVRANLASAGSMRTGHAADESDDGPIGVDGCEGHKGAYEQRPELYR